MLWRDAAVQEFKTGHYERVFDHRWAGGRNRNLQFQSYMTRKPKRSQDWRFSPPQSGGKGICANDSSCQ